jgi:hypothetical protein
MKWECPEQIQCQIPGTKKITLPFSNIGTSLKWNISAKICARCGFIRFIYLFYLYFVSAGNFVEIDLSVWAGEHKETALKQILNSF